MRGSVHYHCLFWIDDDFGTPEGLDLAKDFIDKHVRATVPDARIHPDQHNLVKTLQTINVRSLVAES